MKKRIQATESKNRFQKALCDSLTKHRFVITGMVVVFITLSAFPMTDHSKVVAGPNQPWNVVDTFWGTTSNPIDVGPGDQNVPLSIIIQYLPENDLSATGISIKLDLEQHFTAPIGTDPVATPTLLSVGTMQSQKGPFAPGDVGLVQYVLNIHPIALINHPYRMELRVMYFEDKTPTGGDLEYKVAKVPFEVRILGRPQFEVDILRDTIVAEQDNHLSVKITNIGSAEANDVNLELELPYPLISTMGSRWEIQQIAVQETCELDVIIYATEESVANTYQLSLLITYRDSSGNSQSETYTSGVVVHGNTAQLTSDLKVEFSVGNITGGRPNPLSLRVSNLGSSNVYDVNMALELPPPLILKGTDNRWHFRQIPAQSTQEINIEIYAPEDAISNTYPVIATLTFKDYMGVEQTEVRNLGLLVVGDIDLLIYELSLYPTTVPVGGNFTVSGSILNQGNVEAMYVNVTLIEDANYRTTSMSIYYVGQVDPNAPVPFALTGFLQEDVGEGTYPLTILVSYQDNFGGLYTLTTSLPVSVIPAIHVESAEPANSSIIQRIAAAFFRPIPLVLTAFTLVILWKLLRKKEEEFIGEIAL